MVDIRNEPQLIPVPHFPVRLWLFWNGKVLIQVINVLRPMKIYNNNNKESFYMAQNLKELRVQNMKTQKKKKPNTKTRTAMSWEKLDETGGSWADVWKLRVWEHWECCLEASSKQQKQHSKMSVHQQISGWPVEFSIISQMMIWANEPVGKYEGQKTNKVAKYHQNAGRQKRQVWIGFKTPG